MKRSSSRRLGEVISDILDNTSAADRLAEVKAVEAWVSVVGPHIADRCGRPFVVNGVMKVRIPSAPLRNELAMSASRLLAALNKAVGAKPDRPILKEIKFLY